jgi:hypothetical protein
MVNLYRNILKTYFIKPVCNPASNIICNSEKKKIRLSLHEYRLFTLSHLWHYHKVQLVLLTNFYSVPNNEIAYSDNVMHTKGQKSVFQQI